MCHPTHPHLIAEKRASLTRQLAAARENLRLIEERVSEFVESTDVPLQLMKSQHQTEARIAELEKQLDGNSTPSEVLAPPAQTLQPAPIFAPPIKKVPVPDSHPDQAIPVRSGRISSDKVGCSGIVGSWRFRFGVWYEKLPNEGRAAVIGGIFVLLAAFCSGTATIGAPVAQEMARMAFARNTSMALPNSPTPLSTPSVASLVSSTPTQERATTATYAATPSQTPVHTASATASLTPTAKPTNTATPPPTPTRVPSPTLPSARPPEAILTVMGTEEKQVIDEKCDPAVLASIFTQEAKVIDRAKPTPTPLPYAEFYRTMRCKPGSRFIEIEHRNFDIKQPQPDTLVVAADSCGQSKSGENLAQPWGNIRGDTWSFQLVNGRWRVAELTINNPPPPSLTYTFEDENVSENRWVGCWTRPWTGDLSNGHFLGVSLGASAATAHTGRMSLVLGFDPTQYAEPRARIEHYTSRPLKPISRLSVWIFYEPQGDVGVVEARFKLWEQGKQPEGGTLRSSDVLQVLPGKWFPIEVIFNPPQSRATEKLGLEFTLPKGAVAEQAKGKIYVDDFTIETTGQ